MPYALTVGSFIARRKLIKPVLILATAAGVGVAWLMRRKTSPQQEQL
jgi:lipopolysaccharide export system protein LptC